MLAMGVRIKSKSAKRRIINNSSEYEKKNFAKARKMHIEGTNKKMKLMHQTEFPLKLEWLVRLHDNEFQKDNLEITHHHLEQTTMVPPRLALPVLLLQ